MTSFISSDPMIKIIRKKDFRIFNPAKSYRIIEMLTKKNSKNISCCISEAKNHKEITINKKSDRFYFIISGKMNLELKGKKFSAKKGEVVFIPKNTKYFFSGTFTALQVMVPAFDKKNDKTFYQIEKSQKAKLYI